MSRYTRTLKEFLSRSLNAFSASYERLAGAYSGSAEKKTSLNRDDVTAIMEEAADKVCRSCPILTTCAQNNFYNKYQTVFAILSGCETKGRMDYNDIPALFQSGCFHPKLFADTVKETFEMYKLNVFWQNQMAENRVLISAQLTAASGAVSRLGRTVTKDYELRPDLQTAFAIACEGNRLPVRGVMVTADRAGRLTVRFESRLSCYANKRCGIFHDVLEEALKRRMRKRAEGCQPKDGWCAHVFVEERKFRLCPGVACAAKSDKEPSGDAHTILELENGSSLMALSDGMGSGYKAREESVLVIELLEEFLEAGFDNETAARMINAALLLKYGESSFSTLDICSVDESGTEAEFVKIGASPTFFVRAKDVSVLRATTLPAGIAPQMEVDVSRRKIRDRDLIVMVTDGTADSVGRDDWIADALKTMKTAHPQEVAERLLEMARKNSGGVFKDDCTVLCARVSRN
jgi:stage II sporulation protein E